MRPVFKPGRYANVTATLALVVALGGTSYAAVTITGNNVTNGSLTGADIKNNSIGSNQVAGLRASDFARGQLPVGRRGAAGLRGAPGATGLRGATGPAGARGADGSALAFAHITADGKVDAAASSGINVLQAAGGIYCLDVTRAPVKNFQVTLDVSGADSRKDQASGTAVPAGIAAGQCPAGTDVLIATAALSLGPPVTATTAAKPFYIAIIA